MGYLGIPRQLALLVSQWRLSPYELVAVLAVLYIILGCFLDGGSIIVITLPITLPLVTEASFSPIWFGIFLVIMAEVCQITPPVGFNLFVLQKETGEEIGYIVRAAMPFFTLLLLGAVIMTLFPQIVLWLPGQMGSR